jgi:hypothetical protein
MGENHFVTIELSNTRTSAECCRAELVLASFRSMIRRLTAPKAVTGTFNHMEHSPLGCEYRGLP